MRLAAPIYAFSLIGVTLADCGVEGGTIVVANPNYKILDELDDCSTIFGNIFVDPEFVFFISNGPRDITGTLIAHNNTILKFISLSNVTHLGGFSFASPQTTGRIYLPAMTRIDNLEWRNITWQHDEDYFEWHAKNLVAVSSLNVEATDLSGFYPDYASYDGSFSYDGLQQLETANNIRVVNNRRMDNVEFSGLGSISGSLIVGNNINNYRILQAGKINTGSRLISFPALKTVGSVVIYDEAKINTTSEGKIDLPTLGHVLGDFNVTNTEGFAEISVPALTDIDGGLYILDNNGLKSLDFPGLRRVKHIVLDGGDSHDGGFEKITFPVLEEVDTFHLNSPGYMLDCSSLDHIREIATEFSCSNSEGIYYANTSSPSNERSVTSRPIPTDKPSHTNEPGTTDFPDSRSNTGRVGATPTNQNPTDASGSTLATSSVLSLEAFFRIISSLLNGWALL
ncbi:hypothetical protein F4859DRAFT_375008 [Xylaria cf. heliscus]|nr:hypothetical protein F4859DRAFT_375008 [Xylaria cf. heliscus]